MHILIIGGGGREHALAWKIKQSPLCSRLFIAPGNAGTASIGTNVALAVNDFKALEQFINEQKIDLVVVGPEDPLVAGIVDVLAVQTPGVKVIGPAKFAAQLEGSKAFAKAFMRKYNIPTANYAEFTQAELPQALEYIDSHSLPIVIKADGLAAGKGVIIAENRDHAKEVCTNMLANNLFGAAGAKVVIEQFLSGIEVSVFALTDGRHHKIIGHAKDYKRIGEGDTGLNTGGMGCVSPVPFMDDAFWQKINERIVEPTIQGIAAENFNYKGFVFFGLINVGGEPLVIEYNCRMGDPETEVIMPLLQNDLVDLFIHTVDGTLYDVEIVTQPQYAVTTVMASAGYPGNYTKGHPIKIAETPGTLVFHAGTATGSRGEPITAGGRVLAVTALANNLQQAAQLSRRGLENIQFEGAQYRSDIGYEF